MNEIAISLKNVSKYYKLYDRPKDRLKEALNRSGKIYHKKFYATKNLNLEIKKGEILGIVGKNGSGKSTLLKLITGVLKPDEGSVTVNGQISALLELGSGFNPEFTGMQNIFFYGTIIGLSKEEMQEKLDDILTFADIGEFIDQPLKTYSSGMKSRLGFAVAVHIDPEILILDEVLAVGDVLFRRKCYAKMEEFFKGGKTIIYVSHDANSVIELCSRAVFLDKGNVLLDSDAKTVMTYYDKYLFARNDKQKQIKEEIESLAKQTASQKNISEVEKKSTPVKNDKTSKSSEKKKISEAYFMPDFTPSNTVEYRNFNVTISDIGLENNEGEPVNVLVQDEEYTYRYTLYFGIDANDVSFGTMITNEKGMKISGASIHVGDKTIDVKKGESYDITYTFTCRLLHGIYYTTTGVSAIINNERVFLNRIIDAYVFKVLKKEQSPYVGLVHLNQNIAYAKGN